MLVAHGLSQSTCIKMSDFYTINESRPAGVIILKLCLCVHNILDDLLFCVIRHFL